MSCSEEDDKLAQIVQDFIESGSSSSSDSSSSSSLPSPDDNPAYPTLLGILENVSDLEMTLRNKVLKYLKNTNSELKTSGLKQWLVMKLNKAGFNASLCESKSSWLTTPDSDYEYIDVVMKDEKKRNVSTRLIVDLDFNSQFEIARPTAAYAHLLEALPAIFVGSEEKLLNIISILCAAAKKSLKERGLHVPPWRTASFMQAKWMPDSQNKATSSARDG